MKSTQFKDDYDAQNPDPITGAPGAHPVGTGIGAATAGTAGAALGTIAGGPIGGVIGAAVGSLVGGLAGKGVAEIIDPSAEETYWQGAHSQEPYYDPNYTFDDYRPAYRVGFGTFPEYVQLGRTFENSEEDLKSKFEKSKGKSRLEWEKARHATRAAWDRLHDTKRSASGNEVEPLKSEMPTSPPAGTDENANQKRPKASQRGSSQKGSKKTGKAGSSGRQS